MTRRCANGRADARGIVEQREEVGVGQQAAERFQHGLAAAPVEQPVMYDRNASHVSSC